MRNFTCVQDLGNLKQALAEAFEIKKDRYQFTGLGKNKTLLMIFFNSSLRTRLSTQKAAMNLGMNTMVLDVNQGAWKLETERGVNATDYEFVITHPEGYELDPRFVGNARVEYDQKKAFEGADFIYAKNWAAYADPNYGKVLNTDRSWTVDTEKMALTNNAYFMHCLPVRRNMIVTDDVIESPQSIVIPEAANREISAQTVLKKILTSLLPGD